MAVYLTSSFEYGGAHSGAVAITQGSGGNSGGGNDSEFDVVVIGTSATVAYSETEAAHGSWSGKMVTPSTDTNAYVGWSTSLTATSLSQAWFRLYCYLPVLPASQLHLVRFLNGSTFLGGIAIGSTSGGSHFLTINEAGTTLTTSTSVCPSAAWFRLEGYLIGSASAGQVQLKIFVTSPDEVTPDETNTSASNVDTQTTITQIGFGNPTSIASFTMYLDDLGVSDTGYLGPSQITGGTGTAALTLAAAAAGVRSQPGAVTGAVTLAASAAGSSRRAGSPPAALTLGTQVTGKRQQAKAVTAGVALAAGATGAPARSGSPSAALVLAGSATGRVVIPPPVPAVAAASVTAAHGSAVSVSPAAVSSAAVTPAAASTPTVT